jgi:hypothetical protein
VFIEDLLLQSCPGSADSPVNLKMLEDSAFLATTGTRADHLGLLTKLLCSLATKFRFEVDLFVGRAFLFGIQVMCTVMTNMANKLMTSLWLASVRTTSSKLSSRLFFGVTAISIMFKDWSKLNIRSPQTKPTGCYEFNSYAFRCSLVLQCILQASFMRHPSSIIFGSCTSSFIFYSQVILFQGSLQQRLAM